MNGYRYLTGKYYEYYLEFSSDDVNDSATNFKSEVELLSEEFENVKNIIVNWSGEGAIAMSDSAINNILTKFEVTKKNIDTTLLPATEAVAKLVEELKLMKEKEDLLIQKEQELETEKAKSISKTVYDGTDSQGQPIYKDNPKYNSWVKRKNELQEEITALITELDAIKSTCDTYIDTISQLESSIEEFTNYLGITSTVLGINGESVDFASMSLDERLSYLDSLLANYNEVMAQLNEFYEKTYGKGFTFSSTDFAKLDVLFDCFNIYDKADVSRKDLVSSYGGNNTVIFNIEALTKLMTYCTENDVFGKIERYANGQSWEESGIASLYEDEWFEYDEKDFLKKMKNDYGIKDVKTYLKNNFSNMKNSYANLTSSYQEYKDLVISMQTMEAKITQLNKAKELLPFEYEMENPAFLNYLNKNYTTYGLLDEEKLQYMSQQEVALYDYLYHNKSPQEAAKYLKAMEDAINQRIGAYKAAEYVEWICQDGFQVTDLAASGYEGFKDGVRNWWDGICDLGRVSSTEAGTKSALDYELMYKSIFMLDAAEGYSANMPEDMRELINQVYQTGSSVGNMAVPMLAGFIPVVGKPLSSALMGLSIAGNSAVEAKQSGATTAQAYLYGVASGVSEATTERLLGGIPGVSNLGKSFLGNMASEGLEEFTQTYMDAGLRNIILGENNDLGSKDLFLEAWESGKQGAITSGVLQMGNAGVSTTLNTTTSMLTGGKITNYGVFKNTVEQNYYMPKAEAAINTSLETLASGNKLSMGESIKLSRAINNVSAQELSSITENLTTEQQSGLQDALKSNLGLAAKSSIEKIDTASTFIKAETSGNLQGVEDLGSKLREEFTRDGRTLGEYLVETKPETITQEVISQVKGETGNINVFKTINNKLTAHELSTSMKNATTTTSVTIPSSNTTQPFQNSEYREELSSGYVENNINHQQESYEALETNNVQPNSNQIVPNPKANMTSQVEAVSTTTNPTIVQENTTAELFTPIQQQAKSIATTSNQNITSQTSPRINTSQVVTAGAGISTLGLGGFAIGNNISTSTDVSEKGTARDISQTRKVQSTPQTEQISRGQVTQIRDDASQTVETNFNSSLSDAEVMELANYQSPTQSSRNPSYTARETTTFDKINGFAQNNMAKKSFISSLFKTNRPNITKEQREVVKEINAMIRNGQRCNYSVATSAEISTAMLSEISDLSMVTITIDGGFRDINGNFKSKYSDQRYKARTTFTGLEAKAIISKMEDLQSRIDMSLPEIARARQIYEMIAKEYKYMTDFSRYKDGHMIAAGLRGMTSQNATGKAGLVCAGYAQLYKELCNRAGITCEYIRGEGILDGTSEPHAWNVLLIDGKEIPVDVTWKAGGRREWFGKSEEFARSHKADADEVYANYAPPKINIANVITTLDAKHGPGNGLVRLINYVSTENINEITRENGLRNLISEVGKTGVQNALINHLIPIQHRVQIESAVNTILQKYSPQESSLILQEYLKTGRTDIITSTNGAKGVFTTIPSTQINTYIQIMHPEIYVQTNSSNSVQPSQSVVINSNQINSNVQQITYTPNEIQVIKDVEYAIEQMQAKYGYSRAEILERVNKLVQTNNWLQITNQGNARDILQQYTLQELKVAHDALVSIENVPRSIEEYVKYATDKYMERYNATIEEAINQVQEVINKQNLMYMTSFGNAREILRRCSFGEMQQALNKISLQSKINEIVNSIDISEVNRTTSEFFEQTGNPNQGNYGVDQGALYRMFEFVDHNGSTLSYREAKDIVNEYKKTNRPLPKLKKVGTDEYFDLKAEIMKKYGFTNAEASILFTCIDDAGACSYASVCNEIFNYFKGNSTLFEKTFGFPMYKTINNEQVLNSEKLLIDLYIFANSKGNRGKFIFQDASGHYHIDASQLTSTVDPLGRRLLDSEEQVYMSGADGKNVYLINKYLKTKGLGYNSNRVVKYRSNTNSQNMNSVINHVIEGMKSGKGYSLGIYAHGRPINMIAPRGSNYGSTSTHTWNEGGGHSVFITDVSTEGFIVSSWGAKYTIPFQDLLKNNHWILTEGQISLTSVKVNPLEAFKKLKGETKSVNRTQVETQLTENTNTSVTNTTTTTKTKVKTNPVSELIKLKKKMTSPVASKIESTTNNAQRANSTQSQIVTPLSTSINQNKTGATLSKKTTKVNPVSELIKIKKGQAQITETTTSATSKLTTPAYVEELSSGVTVANDTNSIAKNKQPITIDLSKEAMQKQYIRIYTNIIDRMLKGENGQSLMNSLPLEDKINIIMLSQMAVELDEDYLIQEFDKLAKKYGEETYLKAAEQLVINPSTFISRNEIEQILSEFAETHPIVEILKNTGLYYESYESFDGAKIIEMLKSGLVKPENLTETVLNKKCNIGEEDMTILEYIITKPSSYENNYRFLLEQAKTNPSLAKKFVDFGKIKNLIDVINMIVSEGGQEKSLFEYAIQHNKIANHLITEVVIESVTFDCDINLTTLNGNSVDVNIKKGKLDLDTEISVNGEKQRMIDFMIQYDIFPNTISSISDMLDKITDSQRKQQVCNCIAEHTNILPELNNIGGKAEDIIETRRIIISKLYNLNDTRLITDFYNFIARNPEYITIENFDIVEVKIVNLLNKIYYSNSDELRRVGENIIDVLIRSSENIVETFEKVEEIFVKNNLPFVGKIFKVFEVLHPNFSGFDFSEVSRVSPILKQKSANNHNSLYRKIVTFSDLIKASFGSNNRNIKNYLSNIEISTKIYESVINGIRSVESLTFQETKELEKFRDHLITMYNNTLLKTIKEQDFIPTDNVISDIHKLKILISPDGTDNYNLANRVVSMFTEFSDIRTLEDAKRYMYSKVDVAHSRNVAAAKKFSLEKGDLVKGIGDVKYLRNILQNGSVSREYLGVAADSDATPLDTDVSMVQKESGTINEKIEPLVASSYGPIYFILKNDDRFITTRTIDGMSKESYSMTEALSKMELFHSGWVDDHYGIRTGFASSEINYIMMKNYDNRVGVEIATNGFYIPVVDFEGNLLFSIEDYDSLRTKMAGLSYYGTTEFTLSNNLINETTTKIRETLADNNEEVKLKRGEIIEAVSKVLKTFGLEVHDNLEGNLTYGTVEFIDTGSTGRGTNKPGDGDFDFIMKLDNNILSNQENMSKLRKLLLERFEEFGEIDKKEFTGDGDFRLKGVQITPEIKVDIDITFTQKTDKVDYSTDMAVRDRLRSIKEQNPEMYDYVIANILQAKKVLTEANVYKAAKSDPKQGGFGGVGVENWILQNGGSFVDAARSFLKVTVDESGNSRTFEGFVEAYPIWDFGDNHLAKGRYPHDNFVTNMSASGYEKMKEVLREFLKAYDATNN